MKKKQQNRPRRVDILIIEPSCIFLENIIIIKPLETYGIHRNRYFIVIRRPPFAESSTNRRYCRVTTTSTITMGATGARVVKHIVIVGSHRKCRGRFTDGTQSGRVPFSSIIYIALGTRIRPRIRPVDDRSGKHEKREFPPRLR